MTPDDNHKSHYVHSIIRFNKGHKFSLVKLIWAQKYYFSECLFKIEQCLLWDNASTWCNLNFMANKYTLTVCEHRKLMFLYVFRYNEKWTLILLVCRWRHSGHLGRQEQRHFSSLGSNLYFHVNSSRKQFYCTYPQHCRLVTWLQTKNTHMVTWYQWRRRGCHQSHSGECSDD